MVIKMSYVSKKRLIGAPISGEKPVENLLKAYIDGCSRKKVEDGPIYRNVTIPFSNGSVNISRGQWYNDATAIQAQFSFDNGQMSDFLKKATLKYGVRRANQESYSRYQKMLTTDEVDNFALYFEKNVNASEFFGDKTDTVFKVPLTMEILPGILKKDDENSAIEIMPLDINFPQFVKQIVLNTQGMEKINAEYMAKKGIDPKIYGQALLMAETAKKELGFDYKKIKGDCVSLVCSCPQQVSHEKLILQLLEDMNKDSFKELGINLADCLDAEITLPAKDKYNIKIEAALPVKKRYKSGSMDYAYKDSSFLEFFNSLTPEISEGSEISYAEFEPSSAAFAAKKIGRYVNTAAKKSIHYIPHVALVAFAGWILYEVEQGNYEFTSSIPSPLPYVEDALILGGEVTAILAGSWLAYKGVKYAKEKTKDSPIVHPLKARKKKMREETELLKGHFKKLGIKPNITRGESCILQYDKVKCLEIERGVSK